MKDGLGNEIKIGDVVLYAEPMWHSRVHWHIEQVHAVSDTRVYFSEKRNSNWTIPERVVVIKALLGQ